MKAKLKQIISKLHATGNEFTLQVFVVKLMILNSHHEVYEKYLLYSREIKPSETSSAVTLTACAEASDQTNCFKLSLISIMMRVELRKNIGNI